MSRAFLLPVGIGLMLLQAGLSPALAAEGRVNAAAYAPVPLGSAVMVVPLDDTEDNLQIKDVFEQALQARGYRIAPDASLVMTFWTSGSYDLARRGRRGPGLLQLGAEGGTSTSTDVEAQVKLFSSRGGGLFQNPARRPSQQPLGATRHRLDAVLNDQQQRRRIWQGQSYADVSGGDPLTITESMVTPLIESFGKTVRHQAFTVE
ncbi:MAG: hypothetical protein ACE5JZ_01200 [Kiloniellales bacterium]